VKELNIPRKGRGNVIEKELWGMQQEEGQEGNPEDNSRHCDSIRSSPKFKRERKKKSSLPRAEKKERKPAPERMEVWV